MSEIAKRLIRFVREEDGPTAVEYAVMLALVIVVCLISISAVGQQTNDTFSTTSAKLKTAAS
jgi:pilus assembly protein Flp/PilA